MTIYICFSEKPKKPARSISKNSNNDSPPVSAGLRPQEEPICNSFFEAYTRPIGNESRNSSCYDNVSNGYEDNSDNNVEHSPINKYNRPDMIARIKPIRTMTPCSDGLNTIERQRRFTLEQVGFQYDQTHQDGISCLDGSTSSDHIIKRGSSEHLDPVSPNYEDNISGIDIPSYEDKKDNISGNDIPSYEDKKDNGVISQETNDPREITEVIIYHITSIII